MSKKDVKSCMACGKAGHKHMTSKPPWSAYLCPLNEAHRKCWWGKTGGRTADGSCSVCGNLGFSYNNGFEFSEDGVRGYRCMDPHCGAIKPEETQ
jgi:hypothetical protein